MSNSDYSQQSLRGLLAGTGAALAVQGIFNKNVIKYYTSENVSKFVYFSILIMFLYVGWDRDYYLPFLGDTVFPNGLLAAHVTPNSADTTIEIKVPPNTKVIYWAAEPCDGECDKNLMAWDAYGNYSNSGVATSNDEGVALLSIRGPPPMYKVPNEEYKLKAHVHYRYQTSAGMFSKIYTSDI